MNLPNKFSSIYSGSCEITIDQCNTTNKLRITDLCNLLQAVAGKHSALGGMSYFDMQQNKQAWVLSSMRIEIENLPQWHENIEICTWIESLKGLRSVRDFEVLMNNEKIIGANSLWVVLNTEKRRPESIALPHNHLTKYPDKKPTKKPFSKIDLTQASTFTRDYTVVYSDLDVLNHVNNVKYIEWCLDSISIAILENKSIKAVELNYLKEVLFNEKVSIYISEQNHDLFIYVQRNDEICFAMKLEIEP
ncbi:acyl-[acyl-carrier-protein] thioesterase [Flavobacterium sp. xlx-214]|uniref:acyl-[acyl-carrier-protein] thioesterase n=1 Tax=unclassified Flavobacterium TaxID=196869 RepID=UPI0013D3DF77|nr:MULTISPECIES: acyl-ACP thioesterase domain-containing protein [unclassified Flavobacterium]MBA5791383.1 acyl-[acyl-carrier-protein] thioesterase [Flavobacterium sp. xlx-221]QMI83465.1 acyl-[acyl-carrier-protein] thioesterase [Flavobacterium sp. xlx-214]